MVADVQAQLHSWWAPALAFAAGLVSFASPCVLPLVPGYLAFVTGQAPGEAGERRVGPVLLFIAGFSTVFIVLFGFTASATSRWLHSSTGERVAGAVLPTSRLRGGCGFGPSCATGFGFRAALLARGWLATGRFAWLRDPAGSFV